MKPLIVLSLLATLLVSGCSTGFPACVREHARQQTIRWGEIHSNNAISGYELSAQATLFVVQQKSQAEQLQITEKGSVGANLYCERLDLVRRAFIEVQALNVPGETRRFVEYRNPQNDVEMRAVWNPEYDTKGNELFRSVYDSLESLRKTVD